MNLTTATPAEIDAEWAPIAGRESQARAARYLAREQLHNAEVAQERGLDKLPIYSRRSVEEALENRPKQIAQFTAAIKVAVAEQVPFETEWNRRGGWTRAYLVVTNGTGHVHRTTHCSTCYPTTQFSWITEFSGLDEQAIVDAAGERACTVCYASAPVELRLDRPTSIFSADEKAKQAARTERETKRAAKEAAKIIVPGFREFGRTSTKEFGTTRAATNYIASELGSLCFYGETHPSAPEWIANIKLIREALALKGVEYDYDKALAAARTKTNREAARYGTDRTARY